MKNRDDANATENKRRIKAVAEVRAKLRVTPFGGCCAVWEGVAGRYGMSQRTLRRADARVRVRLPILKRRTVSPPGSRAISPRARRWLPRKHPGFRKMTEAWRRFARKCRLHGERVPHPATYLRVIVALYGQAYPCL